VIASFRSAGKIRETISFWRTCFILIEALISISIGENFAAKASKALVASQAILKSNRRPQKTNISHRSAVR
jgi:Mn2+/Fe2+ NRAMP family transporter